MDKTFNKIKRTPITNTTNTIGAQSAPAPTPINQNNELQTSKEAVIQTSENAAPAAPPLSARGEVSIPVVSLNSDVLEEPEVVNARLQKAVNVQGGKNKIPLPPQREFGRGKQWFIADPRFYKFVVAQRAMYGNISPELITDRFIREFGNPEGRTKKQIKTVIHYVVYMKNNFQKDVERIKARINGDLSATAPFVLANARLQALSEMAEEELAYNQNKRLVLDIFKSIRDELGVGGKNGNQSPVFNLNIQNAQGGQVTVTVGELFGLPESAMEGINPERLTGQAQDMLNVGRKAALALSDGTSTAKDIIDVEASELPDMDTLEVDL